MDKKYNVSVIIGRFQPIHKAHLDIIKQALLISDNLIIVIGSDNQPRTPKNPFTSAEREDMIFFSLPEELQQRIEFAFIQDSMYNTQDWIRSVQNAVSKARFGFSSGWGEDSTTVLIGHHKDASSFYLDMFPQWKSIEIPLIDDLHSTDIREVYFNPRNSGTLENLPEVVKSFMRDFERTDEFFILREEWECIKAYKESWKAAPYPPTFVTTDAVVIQSGHVLLVKRRASPGKGLYALPGGFLDQNESMEDGMIRELREETKIKVPEKVLRGFIKKSLVFDAPNRSLRGRTNV